MARRFGARTDLRPLDDDWTTPPPPRRAGARRAAPAGSAPASDTTTQAPTSPLTTASPDEAEPPTQRVRRGLRWALPRPGHRSAGEHGTSPAPTRSSGPGGHETPEPDTLDGGREAVVRALGQARFPGEVTFDDAGVLELPVPTGYRHRTSARKARSGWYAPTATASLTSTRQAEVLNTALVAAPTGPVGVLVGRDRLSQMPVAHDPYEAYARKIVTSPNVAVLGCVGAGKSSLIKTAYVLRPLILRGRRAVVMDRKDRNGEGEYSETCRELGGRPLHFVLGGSGTRLNILDPLISAGSQDGAAGQARLLIALAELANDSHPLDKWEKAALRTAHRAALRQAEADDVVPVLEHLLKQLPLPQPEYVDYSPAAMERIHQAGLGVHHLLSALLADELAGLFDGPTSQHVRLNDRLTVFDLSQLPGEGPAASMVIAVANVWLMGTLRGQRGLRTNFVAEEGWDLVGGPGGKVFQRNAKLARGLGLSNIAALHHVADIPESDPAIAMLKEAQTTHLFRQDNAADVDAVVSMFGLDLGARATLRDLSNGHHLLKIGNRREIHVEHLRSTLETSVTDTDEAMRAGGTAARGGRL